MTKARALLPANKIHGVDLSQGLKLSHLNTIKGNLFEKMVRAELGILNAGKNGFTSLTNRKTAIADLPLDHRFGVTDIKNVRYLTNSGQLKTLADAAQTAKMPFNLIVSPNAQRISAKLYEKIRFTGGKIHQYNPMTGTFSTLRVVEGRLVR